MKISIAMCTYNGERYIAEQIRSILNQTLKPDEILICDDLSTDNTKNILKDFASKYPNIKLIFNEKNLGFVKNFEKAISLCSGEIIFLSDQDDVWEKEKIKKMIDAFRQFPKKSYIFSNADAFNENKKLNYTLWDSVNFNSEKQRKFNDGYQKEQLLRNSFIYGSTLAFRANFKKHILPISSEFYHDNWIVLILSFLDNNAGKFIPESLIKYRVHSSQSIGLPTNKKWLRFFRDFNNLRQSHKKGFEKKIRMLSDLKIFLETNKILTQKNRTYLDELLYFFSERNRMYEVSKGKRIKMIFWLYKNNFYKKYSTSNWVTLKDIIQKVIL